jgi:UDP-N-acetylmuramyl pentapeptide phosphotransferase/UDP-N-acetylglucosamine-1-phosphate transferase
VLFVAPFVLDGGLTIIRRALRGENIFQAHRSHIYQRLVIAGRSHRAVTGQYRLLMLLGGACGFSYYFGDPPALLLAPATMIAVFAVYTARADRISA